MDLNASTVIKENIGGRKVLAIELCSCNYAEKEPSARGKVSMLGKVIGKEFYCKKCGKDLSQKDIDTFGYELRPEDD